MGKKEAMGQLIELIERWGGRFSADLGIDLESGNAKEVFKWFLASILFGARINRNVAMRTYREFAKRVILSPDDILRTGWHGLVEILDAGGYVRYDFKTASKLLDIATTLNKRYGGNLNQLHEEARDARNLELKLVEFKGIGPVTVNIFLRELREIWSKADPLPSPLVVEAARNLGLTGFKEKEDAEERRKILIDLKRIWKKEKLPYRFSAFEAALVKFGIEQRRKRHR